MVRLPMFLPALLAGLLVGLGCREIIYEDPPPPNDDDDDGADDDAGDDDAGDDDAGDDDAGDDDAGDDDMGDDDVGDDDVGDDDVGDDDSGGNDYGPPNNWWHADTGDVPPGLQGTGFDNGDTAYNFTLMDQNGDQVELYQFYGKVIVLDVFTYW
jgi:hypothetical protein